MNLKSLFAPGLQALRRNWPPLLAVQVLLITLVIAYYRVPDVQTAVTAIGTAKVRSGVLGALVAGAFAGGLIPEFAKALTGHLRLNKAWTLHTAFIGAVYGVQGVVVDFFYKGLDLMFHGAGGPGIVAVKTLIDQGIMTPLFFVPYGVGLFHFLAVNFDRQKYMVDLRDNFYIKRCFPTMVMNWAYWIPVLVCAFSLPLPLQFPVAMLAEAAWSIVMVWINVKQHQES